MTDKAKKTITEAEMERVTIDTKKALDAMTKVSVKIPVNPEVAQKLRDADGNPDYDHKDWPFTPVQINGYTYQIKHGIKVDVPEEIANILERGNRI